MTRWRLSGSDWASRETGGPAIGIAAPTIVQLSIGASGTDERVSAAHRQPIPEPKAISPLNRAARSSREAVTIEIKTVRTKKKKFQFVSGRKRGE